MKRIFSCSSSQVAVESWNKQDQKLLEAVERGDVSRVSALAARKTARPAKLNAAGQSAFHLAASKGLTECLTLLLAHGAPVNERNEDGSTALHLATIACQPQCVKVLLQHGANEGHVDGQDRTPLHWAASSGCASSVLLLCDHEAVLDVTDARGQTPLMLAAWGNHAAICAQLLRRGADPHLADKDNKTALALARERGSLESAELLLRHGTAPGDKDQRHCGAQPPGPGLRRLLRGTGGTAENGTDLLPARGEGTPGSGSEEEEEDEEQGDGQVRQLREQLERKSRECHRLAATAGTLRQRVRELARLLPGGTGTEDEDEKDEDGTNTCLALLARHLGELKKRRMAEEERAWGHQTVAQPDGDPGAAALAPFLSWLGGECAELREGTAGTRARIRGLRREVEGALRGKLHYEVVPAGAVRKSLAAWDKMVLGLEQALGRADRTHAEVLERARVLLENLPEQPLAGKEHSQALVKGTERSQSLVNGMEHSQSSGNGMEGSQSLVNGLERSQCSGNGMEGSQSLVNGMERSQSSGNGMEGSQSLVNGMERSRSSGNGMEGSQCSQEGSERSQRSRNGTELTPGGKSQGEAGNLEKEMLELKESNGKLLGELARLGRERERLREELRRLRERDGGSIAVPGGAGAAGLAEELAAEREETRRLRRRLAGQRRELAELRDALGERAREAAGDGAGILRELQQKLDGLVRAQQEALQLVAEMDGDGEDGTPGELGDALGELEEEMGKAPGPHVLRMMECGDSTGGGLPGREPPEQPLGPPEQPMEQPPEPSEPSGAEAGRWRAVAEAAAREKEAAEARAAEREQELRELREREQELERSLAELRERAGDTARACRDREGTIKKLLAETEKLSAEVLGLRGQSARLQLQLELQQKNHRDIVAVYRTHLLNAAQGFMDEGVHSMLLRILQGPEEGAGSGLAL